MRAFLVILFFLISMLLLQCKMQQEAAYELPVAMIATAKVEFAKQCEKGKILYDINCASCHNSKVKRKEIIPDFTAEQLIGYELRVKNPEHESGIPETTVSTEELGYIMTFLSYKRKSGKVFISSKEKLAKDH
jgi:mono/diheme cytochrome c family protein